MKIETTKEWMMNRVNTDKDRDGIEKFGVLWLIEGRIPEGQLPEPNEKDEPQPPATP